MKCSICGGKLTKTTDEDTTIKAGGRTFTMKLPAERCEACGEVFTQGVDLEGFERAVARKLATLGPMRPDTFKRLRKMLGLRAADLAELFGVRAETISRWETGATPIDYAAWAALGGMVLEAPNTATIDRLRAAAKPPKVRMPLDLTPSGT